MRVQARPGLRAFQADDASSILVGRSHTPSQVNPDMDAERNVRAFDQGSADTRREMRRRIGQPAQLKGGGAARSLGCQRPSLLVGLQQGLVALCPSSEFPAALPLGDSLRLLRRTRGRRSISSPTRVNLPSMKRS